MAPEVSVKVKFKATPDRRTWRHKPASAGLEPYGDSTTMRVRPPVILEDGDAVDMTPFEAEWALVHYPLNFEKVTPKSKKEGA